MIKQVRRGSDQTGMEKKHSWLVAIASLLFAVGADAKTPPGARPLFSLSCDSISSGLTLPQRSSGTITCTVRSLTPSFIGPVKIVLGSGPAGLSLSPLADSITISKTGRADVAVGVNVGDSVQTGKYMVQIAATSGGSTANFSGALTVVPNTHRVHVIYLVPSDVYLARGRVAQATRAIERAVRHGQIFYRNQMGNGKAFTLTNPVVQVVPTSHVASWYASHNPSNDPTWPHVYWWGGNVRQDAWDLVGAGYYQPNDTWLIYADAAVDGDQLAGATAGLGLLHKKDIDSVMGIDPEWTTCRGVGGDMHELGHTFYLPHPPLPWTNELMGTGYSTYPNAFLTPSDKDTLNADAFFSTDAGGTSRLWDCSSQTSF